MRTPLVLLAFQGAITVIAGPSGLNPPALVERTSIGWGVVAIYEAVKDYLKNSNAYDNVPDKCNLKITTRAGRYCNACVYCKSDKCESPAIKPGPGPGWNVCYLGGRQYLNHPELGDFSVTFTKAGGKDGDTTDGLHTPIVQFANLNNWDPWDIEKIISDQGDKDTGNLCRRRNFDSGQELGWECGIPKIGGGAIFGMQMEGPDAAQSGFTPGWCSGHIVQYQRNEYGVGLAYEFDIVLFDKDGKQIGHVSHMKLDGGGHASMTSRLPWTLDITVDGDDRSSVKMAYAGQTWACDDQDGGAHKCTLGNGREWGYENGNREGDFGFTC